MKLFIDESITPESQKWEKCIEREAILIDRPDEIRSMFWRDYNRLLHSKAYRRLKHKTQVFQATQNDDICTRIEHVGHVASVSYTICDYLGLNKELAQAIAIGHDIGHAPFGHDGEHILAHLAKKYYGGTFWHEKNSLHFADDIETLANSTGIKQNLKLTYAVRDGLISHCGEVNEKVIFPRKEAVDLRVITSPNEFAPYTWEACVVKIADKISYLGRDIEDALQLNILNSNQIEELLSILKPLSNITFEEINNTVLIHNFIIDLCHFSSPKTGLGLSDPYFQALTRIKNFNYKHIYLHPRLNNYNRYAELVLTSIFETLDQLFNSESDKLLKEISLNKKQYPMLIEHFENWLIKYSNFAPHLRTSEKYQNNIIYSVTKNSDYRKAIVDFISSLSDNYAIQMYQEIIRF
jgi:dGTPase